MTKKYNKTARAPRRAQPSSQAATIPTEAEIRLLAKSGPCDVIPWVQRYGPEDEHRAMILAPMRDASEHFRSQFNRFVAFTRERLLAELPGEAVVSWPTLVALAERVIPLIRDEARDVIASGVPPDDHTKGAWFDPNDRKWTVVASTDADAYLALAEEAEAEGIPTLLLNFVVIIAIKDGHLPDPNDYLID